MQLSKSYRASSRGEEYSMSVKFDKTNDNGSGDWLKADDDTLMDPSIPFSVSIWFYFATEPGETQTIWFHGDKGEPRIVANSNDVVHSMAA